MESTRQSEAAFQEAVQLGYQPQRTPLRGLLVFIVLGVVSVGVVQGLVWWFMKELEARNMASQTRRSIVAEDQTPPSPQLQPSVGHDATDKQDLAALRARENALFEKLGWKTGDGAANPEIPSDVVRQVVDQQRTRAAAAFISPTTTGRDSNSILPATLPSADKQPAVEGGRQ